MAGKARCYWILAGGDEGIRTPDPLRAKQIGPDFRRRPPKARNIRKGASCLDLRPRPCVRGNVLTYAEVHPFGYSLATAAIPSG